MSRRNSCWRRAGVAVGQQCGAGSFMGRRAATLASGRRVAELGACAINHLGHCWWPVPVPVCGRGLPHGGRAGHSHTWSPLLAGRKRASCKLRPFHPRLGVSARRSRALRRARCPPTRSSRTGPRAARRRCVCQPARHPMRRLHRSAPKLTSVRLACRSASALRDKAAVETPAAGASGPAAERHCSSAASAPPPAPAAI